MDSRREFLKKAAALTGAAGLSGILPDSIQRAFAINPAAGTTFLDAEHVVILMQENRSFDHCYGALQGVRGFNDPRAVRLPDKKPVWLQTNAKGETYVPFRLNIKDTNATWMGSLPHGWTDQTDARNNGRYDQWLEAKKSGHKEYNHMPLTLGYYDRQDVPFYYSLADAFTVCDQNFCSSLTGTTPNRLHLWSGKIREDHQSQARVRNEEADYGAEAAWKTFPERLEDNNVSWRIYQNEISVGVGFEGEEDSWLGNFTDNAIEFFLQFQVKFLPAHMQYLPTHIERLRQNITEAETKLKSLPVGDDAVKLGLRVTHLKKDLDSSMESVKMYTRENFEKLTTYQKNIHTKAFTTNVADPDYHTLASLNYKDGDTEREMKVPKGDVFHQFRNDVKNGTLPTVSWLVAPENFSDHPGAPWYGAWYLSEAMDILTKDPEVWKKTIFILCYDENDGYFDHVPPFVPPVPGKPETGLVSKNIDTEGEFVKLEDDLKRKPERYARGGPIGLGYRVPLVIASPWSRGGAVCSQVFDHTSIIQFLEVFTSHKAGKKIEETNISSWRRTVCGDLTSVFKPYSGEATKLPSFLSRDQFVESIHKAQFKGVPSGFHALTPDEIAQNGKAVMPKQEKGSRTSRALPYELYADGKISDDRTSFDIHLAAGNAVFADRAVGSPFQVYSYNKNFTLRNYAVSAGAGLDHQLKDELSNNLYDYAIHGPNGFYREFKGSVNDPLVAVICSYTSKSKGQFSGNLELKIVNRGKDAIAVTIRDNAYKQSKQVRKVAAGVTVTVVAELAASSGWYDLSVLIDGVATFENRFAGRVETGKEGVSDPAMA